MSILDALSRGWYSGWAEFPELAAGGTGLLESLIPGEQESLTSFEEEMNKKAGEIRAKGGPGKSEGILEKIAEGLGAAPGTVASMAPFLLGGEAALGAGVLGAAAGFGAHALTRSGDEDLRTAVGHGLKGAAEGAAFGFAGRVARGLTGKTAKDLFTKQKDLYGLGTKESVAAAKAMQPEIDAALALPQVELKRRAAHAGLSAGIVGGMGVVHGQSPEDIAASAGTMGILGALGGMTPKAIKEGGKYRDPFAAAKRELDALEGEANVAGRERIAKLQKEAEERINQQPQEAATIPEGTVPASDFTTKGETSRPYKEETPFFKEELRGISSEGFEPIKKFYGEQAKRTPLSDADTHKRAAERVFRDENGKLQAPAEDIDALALYLKDLQGHHQAKLNDINLAIERAKTEGDPIGVERYQEMKDAQLLQMQSDFAQFKGVRSTAGNALRVLRGAKRGTTDWLEAASKVKKTLGVESDRVVKMLEMSQDNPELMMKITNAINSPKAWDYFQEYWINALLSGPPTHAVNITSNAYRGALDVVEKGLALRREMKHGYYLTDEAGKFIVDPVTGAKKKAFLSAEEAKGEFMADLHAGMSAMSKALKAITQGFMKDEFDPSLINPEYGLYKRSSKVDHPTSVIKGKPGWIVRTPGRLLESMDLFFKIVAGDRAASAKAYRMATDAIKRGEISEVDRVAYMEKVRGTSGEEVHPEILKAMKREAEKQTFTEKLPKWMAPVEKARQIEVGGMKPVVGVLPFLSTPFNVIKQALTRSPIGILMRGSLKKKYESGEITSKEYHQEMAGIYLGTTMTAVLVGLAKAGLITGSGPENQQDRQNLLATGWRPYSLHIPEYGYFQMQRIEPFGTILGMAGDIAELGDSEDKMGKLMATIKNNATDKSFLYGLESLAKAWSNPEQFGATYYKQMSGSLVPTLFAKAAQATDPYMRQTEARGAELGIPDAMAYRIPGLSQGLPQRSTAFGEPAERWGVYSAQTPGKKVASAVQSMFAPAPISAERRDVEVEKEVDRLRNYPGMPPAMPKRKKNLVLHGVHGESVKLTNEEYAVYDKYNAQAKAALQRVISSPQWASIPDPNKAKLIDAIYSKFRRAANNEINASIRRRTTVGD